MKPIIKAQASRMKRILESFIFKWFAIGITYSAFTAFLGISDTAWIISIFSYLMAKELANNA